MEEQGSIMLRVCKDLWHSNKQSRLERSSSTGPAPDEVICFYCGFANFVGEGHCRQCKTYLDGSEGGGGGGGSSSSSSGGGGGGGSRHVIATPAAKRKKTQENAHRMEVELDKIKQMAQRLTHELLSAPVSCTPQEEEISALGSLPYGAAARHLVSLRVEQIQRLMRPVLSKYMQHPKNTDGMFNSPVDYVALELHDYLARIKTPMDLGRVRSRLQSGAYETFVTCAADIALVFKNAMTYNPASHHVHIAAKVLKQELDADVAALEEKFHKDLDRKAAHSSSCKLCLGEMCVLCGEKCLKFEPPVLVCHGTCVTRIKRNALYYVTTDGVMLWCQKCYMSLPTVVIEGTEKTKLLKKSLLKCKSDEEVSEPWVSCDKCGSWCHQICGLYNDRWADKEKDALDASARYECPRCKLVSLVGEPGDKPTGRGRGRQPKIKIKAVSPASADGLAFALPALTTLPTPAPAPAASAYLPSPATALGAYSMHCVEPEEGAEGDGIDSDDNGKDKVLLMLRDDEVAPALATVPRSCWKHEMNTDSNDGSSNGGDGDVEGITDVDAEEGDASSMDLSGALQCGGDKASARKALSLDSVSEGAEGAEGTSASAAGGHKTRRADDDAAPASAPSTSGGDLGQYSPRAQKWRASSLPRTRMSDFIEAMVADQLRSYGFADTVPTITVRMTSNTDQHVEVPEPIVENMSTVHGVKVPELLGYRQKCVLLFQNIDGVDVCLFCLYVQEFGEACPDPNKSVVYVSYLDSVDFLRPVEARTLVYHEIMVGYLKWVQSRGFKQAHIWSCPPQRGDNFIFWSHPAHQKTPSRDRLNAWYNDMLLRATKLGVIAEMDNLFGAYFQQYLKKERDESTIRNSARYSFVGAGNVKGKGKGKGAGQGSGSAGLQMSISSGSLGAKGDEERKDVAPVCPPVFEGDYWVGECLRVHRSVINRSRGDDGQERDINKRKVREILKGLLSTHNAGVFARPVEESVQNFEGRPYHEVVLRPMDLGTVREKLRKDAYATVFDFAEDVRLVFHNAMLFNPSDYWIYGTAEQLAKDFERNLFDLANGFSGGLAEPDGVDAKLPTYPLQGPAGADTDSALGSPRANTPGGGAGSSFFGDAPLQRANSFDSVVDDNDEPFDGDEDDGARAMTRQNSLDSTVSNLGDRGDGGAEDDMYVRRFTHSRAALGAVPDSIKRHDEVPFDKPELGFRGAMAMMNELSKCVDRLKADLFVIRFAAPGQASPLASATSKRRKGDGLGSGEAAMAVAGQEDEGSEPAGQHSAAAAAAAASSLPPQPRRGKGFRGKAGAYLRRIANGNVEDLDETSISDRALALLQGLATDTSDPDASFSCPFLDTRHTFLEMCQFRHYQFDTLRRAKHSSVMLLYHLHNPTATFLRPRCKMCLEQIFDVRWHCGDGCANYNVCAACYNKEHARGRPHLAGHKLTPFRVTFT